MRWCLSDSEQLLSSCVGIPVLVYWIGYPALDTNMGAHIWFQFGCPVSKRINLLVTHDLDMIEFELENFA